MYDFIIQNREFLKLFYAIALTLICAVIVLKTDRLFRLSMHQGIRYFRNAFFFYGIAFILRYVGGILLNPAQYYLNNLLFEFFLILAGFFLVYSLLWKRFEPEKPTLSSLINLRTGILYVFSAIIAFFDYLWQTHLFMFGSQIIFFIFASILSYSNYKSKSKKRKFLKFYFLAMALALIGWSLNFLAATFLAWSPLALMSVYALNVIFFLLFLYGVIKVTSKNGR